MSRKNDYRPKTSEERDWEFSRNLERAAIFMNVWFFIMGAITTAKIMDVILDFLGLNSAGDGFFSNVFLIIFGVLVILGGLKAVVFSHKFDDYYRIRFFIVSLAFVIFFLI